MNRLKDQIHSLDKPTAEELLKQCFVYFTHPGVTPLVVQLMEKLAPIFPADITQHFCANPDLIKLLPSKLQGAVLELDRPLFLRLAMPLVAEYFQYIQEMDCERDVLSPPNPQSWRAGVPALHAIGDLVNRSRVLVGWVWDYCRQLAADQGAPLAALGSLRRQLLLFMRDQAGQAFNDPLERFAGTLEQIARGVTDALPETFRIFQGLLRPAGTAAGPGRGAADKHPPAHSSAPNPVGVDAFLMLCDPALQGPLMLALTQTLAAQKVSPSPAQVRSHPQQEGFASIVDFPANTWWAVPPPRTHTHTKRRVGTEHAAEEVVRSGLPRFQMPKAPLGAFLPALAEAHSVLWRAGTAKVADAMQHDLAEQLVLVYTLERVRSLSMFNSKVLDLAVRLAPSRPWFLHSLNSALEGRQAPGPMVSLLLEHLFAPLARADAPCFHQTVRFLCATARRLPQQHPMPHLVELAANGGPLPFAHTVRPSRLPSLNVIRCSRSAQLHWSAFPAQPRVVRPDMREAFMHALDAAHLAYSPAALDRIFAPSGGPPPLATVSGPAPVAASGPAHGATATSARHSAPSASNGESEIALPRFSRRSEEEDTWADGRGYPHKPHQPHQWGERPRG
ncbi:hypothetical protein PAPYR_151 [Paratrimastix pyriformis]|uniref:Uncharacterized protein n=1 Tax=Paratrimastix pyriformis TaxID=342808 RepID=A0ABQ8UXU3_9EUKA|nr:hypothetical protein PAPYR_151 [Paratrimastix pyriformis]